VSRAALSTFLSFCVVGIALGGASARAMSTPSPLVSEVGYETAVSTKTFEIRDIDFARGRVLFRHVFVALVDVERGLPSVVDCAYPGLGPFESEIVGVYDLTRDAYDTLFVVHPPADRAESCADAQDVDDQRAALAAFVAAEGLSMDAPPSAVQPTPRGDAFVVMVDGKPGRVRVETRRATAEESADATGGGPYKIALGRLYVGDTMVHERAQLLDDTRSVGREIDFLALYVEGTRAVALERFSQRTDGQVPRTLFRVSPAFDLSGAPAPVEDDAHAAAQGEQGAPPLEDQSGCCGGNPILSCGLFACAAPFLSGCVCAGCCVSFCSNLFGEDWGDLLEEEEKNDGGGREDESPPKDGPGGEQYVRY